MRWVSQKGNDIMNNADMFLSFRQREILRLLLSKHGPIPLKRLEDQYHLSNKSIRNDLKVIGQWLEQRGSSLHSSAGSVELIVSELQRSEMRNELSHADTAVNFWDKDDRVTEIIDRLLFTTKSITINELCDALGVSKPTVMSDLEAAEKLIEQKGFRLKRKKGRGYWMVGEETQLRDAAKQRLTLMLKQRGVFTTEALHRYWEESGAHASELLRRYMASIDFRPISELLDYLRNEPQIGMTEEAAFFLEVTALVIIHRLMENCQIDYPKLTQIEAENESRMMALASKGISIIGKYCNISFSLYETQYLVCKFYECGVYIRFTQETARDPGLYQTVEKMCRCLNILLGDDEGHQFRADGRIQRELYDHLNFFIHRKHLQVRDYTPLYLKTKTAYPKLYLAAEEMASIFREEEGTSLTQAEVGMLALLLAAYGSYDSTPKRATLVCDKGEMISKVLARRIRNNVAGLTVETVLTLREYLEAPERSEGVDLVISTIELPESKTLTFVVDPIIEYADLQRIRDFVHGVKRPMSSHPEPQGWGQIEDYLALLVGSTLTVEDVHGLTRKCSELLSERADRLTAADLSADKERYSRKLATIFAKLSGLIQKTEKISGQPVATDSLLGLVIHLTLSLVLWESGGIYPENDGTGLGDEPQELVEAVEEFLNDTSSVISVSLPDTEGIPILQYLKNHL